MGIDLSKDMQLASTAGEEELKPLVYHKSSEVITILINNKNLTEDLAAIIAGRKNIDSRILESLLSPLTRMMQTLLKNFFNSMILLKYLYLLYLPC